MLTDGPWNKAARWKVCSQAGRLAPMLALALGSLGAMVALVLILVWKPGHDQAQSRRPPLVMYCAAGLKAPVEAVAQQYFREYGVQVLLQYGGSGTMLNNLRVAGVGDLFLAADDSYVELARRLDLTAESIPLVRQIPVLAVAHANPKNIRGLADLLRPDVRVALTAPEAASIGAVTRQLLSANGQWDALAEHTRRQGVFKGTVNDVANDVKLGAADAAIVWDSTVGQYPDLEPVPDPILFTAQQTAQVMVLRSSLQPTAALRFARYLGASDKGLLQFARFHYQPVNGDAWAWEPELVLFSGSMLRPAIEQTLREFEQREGVRIRTVYNGCGILTAQMQAGARPDSYFACDTAFMSRVAELYQPPLILAENDIVMIVPRGNPRQLREMRDLTRAGLRVGFPHHEKSAMGALVHRLLQAEGLYEAISNQTLKVESPTGDFLVNQLRTGALDAIMACRSNAKAAEDQLEVIPIQHPLAKAVQPVAVSRHTRYPQTTARLVEKLKSAASRQRFELAGFRWRHNTPMPDLEPRRAGGEDAGNGARKNQRR